MPQALVEHLPTAVRSELNTLEEHSERTAEEQQELCLNDKWNYDFVVVSY
jgi:hypothetical protein